MARPIPSKMCCGVEMLRREQPDTRSVHYDCTKCNSGQSFSSLDGQWFESVQSPPTLEDQRQRAYAKAVRQLGEMVDADDAQREEHNKRALEWRDMRRERAVCSTLYAEQIAKVEAEIDANIEAVAAAGAGLELEVPRAKFRPGTRSDEAYVFSTEATVACAKPGYTTRITNIDASEPSTTSNAVVVAETFMLPAAIVDKHAAKPDSGHEYFLDGVRITKRVKRLSTHEGWIEIEDDSVPRRRGRVEIVKPDGEVERESAWRERAERRRR